MVDLNGIKLKNRFLASAGALGYGLGWPWERPLIKLGLVDPTIYGSIVTKTLTNVPRMGNYIDPIEFEKRTQMSHFCHILSTERRSVLRRVNYGWLNNFSWWNVGIDYWVAHIYPKLKNVTIIVSIGGFVTDHYLEMISKLNQLNIAAIEINISCPNVEHSLFQKQVELVKLFTSCRASSSHPLIVKLGLDHDYLRAARTAQYCGLNAISAINSVPILGGGYSGRGIKLIALKVVADLTKNIILPIIGGGGIYSWHDCQEFRKAGASAVSIGSLHIARPWAATRMIKKYKTRFN